MWDISEHVNKLRLGESTWDSQTFGSKQASNIEGRLHVDEGFVPLLHWSAESDKDYSHMGAVESVQWLPQAVWVFKNG